MYLNQIKNTNVIIYHNNIEIFKGNVENAPSELQDAEVANSHFEGLNLLLEIK